MDLQWPAMVTARPGEVYSSFGERLYWPEYHLSLAIPPACTIAAGQIYCEISSLDRALRCHLSFHDTSDHIIDSWIDEGWVDEESEDGERLQVHGPAKTARGVVFRGFSSKTFVGCKAKIDDPFRNGASARVTAPSTRSNDLAPFLWKILDSIRFVHLERLAVEQLHQSLVDLINLDLVTDTDLILYIDRHFYLMRDDIMETVEAFAKQAVEEGHVTGPIAMSRWKVLQDARRLADGGAWDRILSQERGRPPAAPGN